MAQIFSAKYIKRCEDLLTLLIRLRLYLHKEQETVSSRLKRAVKCLDKPNGLNGCGYHMILYKLSSMLTWSQWLSLEWLLRESARIWCDHINFGCREKRNGRTLRSRCQMLFDSSYNKLWVFYLKAWSTMSVTLSSRTYWPSASQ